MGVWWVFSERIHRLNQLILFHSVDFLQLADVVEGGLSESSVFDFQVVVKLWENAV